MTRGKTFVKRAVWKIIDEMPIGHEFTTQDIVSKIRYGFASTGGIALAIRKHPNIVNTKEKGMAIWRRVE